MVKTLLPEIKDQEALKALAESIGGFFDRLGIRQAEQRQLVDAHTAADALRSVADLGHADTRYTRHEEGSGYPGIRDDAIQLRYK